MERKKEILLDFPKTLRQLHLFEVEGVLYAADIKKARAVELSDVMADILKLAETQTNTEIVQTLKTSYIEDDIFEAFERFKSEGMNQGNFLRISSTLGSTRARGYRSSTTLLMFTVSYQCQVRRRLG